MSKEYIERPSLIGKLTSSETQSAMREMDGSQAYSFFLAMVNSETAADVVEVKHGNWSIRCKTHHDTHTGEYDEEFYLECSSCGREVWDINPADVCNYGKLVAQFPYCHCGAKMLND